MNKAKESIHADEISLIQEKITAVKERVKDLPDGSLEKSALIQKLRILQDIIDEYGKKA